MESTEKILKLKGIIPPQITRWEEQLQVIRNLQEFLRRYPGLGEEVMNLREKENEEYSPYRHSVMGRGNA